MTEERERWSTPSKVGLLVSLVCMLPTVVAGTLLLLNILLPVTATAWAKAAGATPTQAGESGGAVLMFTFLGSMLSALPVSIASVILHPIGAVCGLITSRGGAPRIGLVMMIAHGVTFLIGFAVFLQWSAIIAHWATD